MRILYVHECFGALGGAEGYVWLSASELARRGHEIAILHGPPTGRDEAGWKDLFGFRYGIDEGATARAFGEFRPDVCFVHKTSDLALLDRLRSSGVPVVRMVHDHDIYCMRSYKYNYFTRAICRRPAGWWCVFPCGAVLVRRRGGGFPLKLARLAAKRREIEINRGFERLITVTPYMRDELAANGLDPGRISILAPVPREANPQNRSSFSERNLILYIGQIVRGKGVDVLLDALSLVRDRFECVVLGDGNHRRACERRARKLGLEGRVTFKGYVRQDGMRSYLSEATLVAICSVWPEPIATVGLEAMRAGLPVVAFDAGGIGSWLRDGVNGFLVPWMDRASYARRIETFLRDKLLARQMGEKGAEIARQEYGFAESIRTLESIIESARRRPSGVDVQRGFGV